MTTEYIWFKGGHPSKHTKDELGERPTKVFLSGGRVILYDYYDNVNDNVYNECHFKHGKWHRDGDKPSYIGYHPNGGVSHKEYHKHDKKHRDGDKPSITKYYLNGNTSYEAYYKNNEKHRDCNKPAGIDYHKDGSVNCEEYYKHGKQYQPKT